MIVEIFPVSQTVEINDGKTTVTVDLVQPHVDVQALGAQGPKGEQGEQGVQGPQGVQGVQGPPGENYIAGYGISTTNLTVGDHLEFKGSNWTNVSKTTLTDGGNF